MTTKWIKRGFPVLIAMLLAAAGCAPNYYSAQKVFYKQGGRYMALPPEMLEDQARLLAATYGAVTSYRFAAASASELPQDRLAKVIGPTPYLKEAASDVRAILDTDQFWEILVIPENRDFMTAVFQYLYDAQPAKFAKIKIIGTISPELASEIDKLGLKEA